MFKMSNIMNIIKRAISILFFPPSLYTLNPIKANIIRFMINVVIDIS